jgi:AcrR family transcriptional regulator
MRVEKWEDMQPDTRTRIQDVALRLFNERGYEATSLREIADEVGVTKAALYYHFKTKEEIVTSLIDDRLDRLDTLFDWARSAPPSLERRQTFIQRYADELYDGSGIDTMRFFERNPTALRDHPSGERMREQMLSVMNYLVEPGAPLTERLKTSLALLAVHASGFLLRDESVTDEQCRNTGVTVALELLD